MIGEKNERGMYEYPVDMNLLCDFNAKHTAIGFVKWIDQNNHISVTFGGNGIIHDIEKKYEMYLESLKSKS